MVAELRNGTILFYQKLDIFSIYRETKARSVHENDDDDVNAEANKALDKNKDMFFTMK